MLSTFSKHFWTLCSTYKLKWLKIEMQISAKNRIFRNASTFIKVASQSSSNALDRCRLVVYQRKIKRGQSGDCCHQLHARLCSSMHHCPHLQSSSHVPLVCSISRLLVGRSPVKAVFQYPFQPFSTYFHCFLHSKKSISSTQVSLQLWCKIMSSKISLRLASR